MKFAQTCDSKECKTKYKDEIIKGFYEAVTTSHEIDFNKGIVKCLDCGKSKKFSKT